MSSYIRTEDILNQLSESQLVQLTDDVKSGLVQNTVVDKAIADAEGEINSYVGTRYPVPWPPPIPDILQKLATDIATYRLYLRRQRVPDDVRKAYEDAIALLRDIAKGLVSLGTLPPPASGMEYFTEERIFSRTKMGSF